MHRRKIFEKRIETIKEIVPNVLSFLSAEKNYNMSAKLYLTVIQNSWEKDTNIFLCGKQGRMIMHLISMSFCSWALFNAFLLLFFFKLQTIFHASRRWSHFLLLWSSSPRWKIAEFYRRTFSIPVAFNICNNHYEVKWRVLLKGGAVDPISALVFFFFFCYLMQNKYESLIFLRSKISCGLVDQDCFLQLFEVHHSARCRQNSSQSSSKVFVLEEDFISWQLLSTRN